MERMGTRKRCRLYYNGCGQRVAISWDGDASRAPKLHVEYEPRDGPRDRLGQEDPFKAFNDLSWAEGQLSENITLYTTTEGGASLPQGDEGFIVDYESGLRTPVRLSVRGGAWIGDFHANLGGPASLGTDAHNVF